MGVGEGPDTPLRGGAVPINPLSPSPPPPPGSIPLRGSPMFPPPPRAGAAVCRRVPVPVVSGLSQHCFSPSLVPPPSPPIPPPPLPDPIPSPLSPHPLHPSLRLPSRVSLCVRVSVHVSLSVPPLPLRSLPPRTPTPRLPFPVFCLLPPLNPPPPHTSLCPTTPYPLLPPHLSHNPSPALRPLTRSHDFSISPALPYAPPSAPRPSQPHICPPAP